MRKWKMNKDYSKFFKSLTLYLNIDDLILFIKPFIYSKLLDYLSLI